ncbi:unconventional myosin-XVIIIb isoform X2 [Ictalurus punctatus]|uniref:Unconventional myosin-XVIIIb isoform X2 n=1 Tax=Ictalurus punctatus TaxID=7998 RepID=A0A9F7RLR1_ICTPU|nr:unconventional myosin-XVIIIb isoform X2 [Ictalurus punctatus]
MFPWSGESSVVLVVDDFIRRSEWVWDRIHVRLQRAIHSERIQGDHRRKPHPNYLPGQRVWFSTSDLHLWLPSRKLSPKYIKNEKKPLPATQPPPPLSVVPGGFLKQLVRETEKETRLKEPELKEEKTPSKLSENLVQQFLLPDQTPPILEAEIALRAEQMVSTALWERKTSSPKQIPSPDSMNQKDDFRVSTPVVSNHKHENGSNISKFPDVSVKQENLKEQAMAQLDVKEVKEEKIREVRQEPEGHLADSTLTEETKRLVRDVWYEAGTVWYAHKNGFTLATQMKPDEGTPELPYGKVRIQLHTDGSIHDVTQYEIEKLNPPELDLCEDLSQLMSVNESSILHTLASRAKAHMALTQAGPNLLALWPPLATPGKGLRTHRWDKWEAPSLLHAVVHKVYMSMVGQRRDQSVVALGRSGTGKTTLCQTFAQELLKHAGTEGENVTWSGVRFPPGPCVCAEFACSPRAAGVSSGYSGFLPQSKDMQVERLQAMFTVLHSFGCVSSHHSEASNRFAMVLSLDFNHKGLAAAVHLQTMMLDRWKVCHRTEGESNFLIFTQMLAGLSAEMRSELQLHQLPESNIFGISCPTKVDEKQRATVEFGRLLAAMNTLGFSPDEQRAIWHVLAGIYHLGMAGACKVGRKQFMSFESAQVASAVLGCEGEDLHTAVFKHHLRQLLQRATGATRERHIAEEQGEGPKLSAVQCVEGMVSGLYEELFTAIVSLINRALCSQQLTLGSVIVVDTPGLRNPRHSGKDRAAGFSEFCHNYLQERLLEHHFTHTFTNVLDRCTQERVPVDFEAPEDSPQNVVCAIDQPGLQVRGPEGDPRGLLWVLDEELVTPNSSENTVLERICHYFSDTVRLCEQPLQCEIAHLMGSDPIRYDLSGWFGLVQNNPSALNASSILQNSSIHVVKALFAQRASVPPLSRCLGGVEGGSQRFLERSGNVRKTLTGGMAAIRRHSHCISIKLQVDALINLIRRAQPVFLQCLSAKVDGGGVDVPALRTQLHATHLLPALQLYRIGYPDHMSLSDFRCRFQALSPTVMKRYGSVFITPNERKAVEELLIKLDLDKKSIVLGASKVFLKHGVLKLLVVQRDGLVNNWLVQMQAACLGHLARQRYRRLKVQQMAVRCIQRNVRVLDRVASWSWWKLLCRMRLLLDVNIDEHKIRAKEDEISILRRRLEKSEKERIELRQTADNLETKIMAVVSELSDERFWGEAVSQALDTERAERLRLTKENKELQDRLDQSKVTVEALEKQLTKEKQRAESKETLSGMATEGELQMQLDCAQTEVKFLRRRLHQTDERFEVEKEARELLDTKVLELQAQLEQSKRMVTELKRHCWHVTSDLQDARVLMDSLQARIHDLDRKQRRFDSELTRALEEADNEREQKDKAIQENIALGAEIFSLHRTLKESQLEVQHLQYQKQELCAQIRDLTLTLNLGSDSVPELKKQLRELDSRDKERAQELANMTVKIQQQEQIHLRFEIEMERMKQIHQKELEDKDEELEDVQKSSQRRLRQLEMQMEQEYEEKQMVVHEKHDLEGLIATLCEQVGHRDFDVEKRLRRDLKRTHALLSDAQLLLSTMEQTGQGHAPGTKEQLDRLQCQLKDSEARRLEAESVQKTLAMELENAQLELESICKHKSLVDEQLTQLQYEKADFLKRLEEDQEDLNELMKKHKALIAQSSSDITQIRELQTELEEVKKERQSLQEQLQSSAAHLQFLESSTVARSIVSKQEAHVCDLENKLEFQRGQVKRFEVLVLRLRDSVVRMGEELEQSAQAEARERENSHYYQQRLADMRLEMEDLSLKEQESSCRRMELEMQVEELSAVRQTLQADLETSIRRIADLQAALEEVESSDESDTERDNTSSMHSSIGTEDSCRGIQQWLGVPHGGHKDYGVGVSSYTGNTSGPQSVTDTMSTYSFRSCSQELEDDLARSARILPRASSSTALSELLEGLRKKRTGWDKSSEVDEGSTVSLPIYQPTAASNLRRRAFSLLPDTKEGLEETMHPGILKVPSPLLTHASSLHSLSESMPSAPSATSTLSSVKISKLSIPEELEGDPGTKTLPGLGTHHPVRHQLFRGLTAEGGGETLLGSEPLVFQNRHLLGNPETDKVTVGSDLGDTNSDFVPAIRRSQSISSLASSSSRGGQRRTLSVHFGELPPSRALCKDSDSDASDSESTQHWIGPQEKRLEAEGSEGDVNSVMKKYLKKAEVD